jgi:ligand-binding sensor domain-containing protein/predicted Ser/Thr protein kinase
MSRMLVILLVLAGLGAMGAPPHRWWVGPGGLAVRTLAVGPDGYVWVGAFEGIYRFDGVRMEHMLDFPTRTASSMVFVGRELWVLGDDRVAAFDGNTWRSIFLAGMGDTLATDGKSLFVSAFSRWLKLSGGEWVPIARSEFGVLNFDAAGMGWGIEEGVVRVLPPEGMEGEERFSITVRPRSAVHASVSGRLWASDSAGAVAYRMDGQADRTVAPMVWRERGKGPFVVRGKAGRLWFLGQRITSDPEGEEFRYQARTGKETLRVAAEGEGGEFWVWSPSRGLVRLIPDRGWQVFPLEEFGVKGPTAVGRNGKGELWAATGSGMYRMGADGWRAAGGTTRDYVETLALGDGRMLAASREEGLWILDGEGRAVGRVGDGLKDYRRLFRDRRGRIWVGNRQGLLEAVAEGAGFRLVAHPLPAQSHFPSPIDFAEDGAGTLWVGYTTGLARLNGAGQWERLATDKPIMEVRTVSVARDGKTLWVGYRKNGYYSRVEVREGKGVVTHFTAEAGYGPKDTFFLRVDSRGWVWRGSRDGVRVSDGVQVGPADWLYLHAGNGLAGGETSANGFFEDRDGTVWISGEQGVTHVTPSATWFGAPEKAGPRISRVDVDGHLYLGALPGEVAEDVKKIVVRVGSLAASPFRTQPFRYRVGRGEWTAVGADGEIVLDRLVGGAHRLEVGFAGGGAVTGWDFRVGPERPAYWAYGLGGILGVGLVGYLLRRTGPVEKLRYRVAKRVHALRPGDVEQGEADLVGRLLSGRYRVRRVLNTGGTATVYAGVDEAAGGGEVVLKVLDGRAAETQWARRSFSMEVMALRSIAHPCVVPLLDSWIDEDGRPILVMPFIAGRTLREVIDAGCPVREAVRILTSLGETLDAVHGRGIVHRDVKPENVIVSNDGRVVLLDFGTAGMAGRSQGVVMTEGVAGSLAYMGPERLGGYFSGATDAYSLGVITVELLTGKRPGEEGAELAEAVGAVVGEVLADSPERRPEGLGEWAGRVARASGC